MELPGWSRSVKWRLWVFCLLWLPLGEVNLNILRSFHTAGSTVDPLQAGPILQVPETLTALSGSRIDVPVNLITNGHRINAISF